MASACCGSPAPSATSRRGSPTGGERDLGPGSRLAEARRAFPEDFEALARDVHGTVCREPLPRLQTVGTQRQSFLYTLAWDEHVPRSRPRRPDFDDRIHFVGRAAEFLVRLSGLLRPLLEREWVARVARWNDDLVDPETLADFLFGTTRRSLQPVRGPLLDLQQGRCFYCDTTVREAAVDHFVPWARPPTTT